MKTLADVIAFNEAHRAEEMPYFGQELFLKAQEKGPLTDKAYLEAAREEPALSRAEGIDAVMDEHRLDAIVAPTGGPAWLTDCVDGDHFGGRQLDAGRRGRLPEHHRARGLRLRPARGPLLHRPRLERARPDPPRLRLRAGHPRPPGATLLAVGPLGAARTLALREGRRAHGAGVAASFRTASTRAGFVRPTVRPSASAASRVLPWRI